MRKMDKAFAAACGGYVIKKSRVDQYYFAVFRSVEDLRAYARDYPDHFYECEIACYDGHLNAFYMGYLQ